MPDDPEAPDDVDGPGGHDGLGARLLGAPCDVWCCQSGQGGVHVTLVSEAIIFNEHL